MKRSAATTNKHLLNKFRLHHAKTKCFYINFRLLARSGTSTIALESDSFTIILAALLLVVCSSMSATWETGNSNCYLSFITWGPGIPSCRICFDRAIACAFEFIIFVLGSTSVANNATSEAAVTFTHWQIYFTKQIPRTIWVGTSFVGRKSQNSTWLTAILSDRSTAINLSKLDVASKLKNHWNFLKSTKTGKNLP